MRSSAACLVVSLWISCLLGSTYAATFSSLHRTLILTASPKAGQVLKAGEDNITLTWSLNTTFASGIDSTYKSVTVKLCYAPISQKDRGWRKTVDELAKDKTCQHKILTKPYTSSNNTFTWSVRRDVPGATYFVRAYALDSAAKEVAFGQTTDSHKTTNLFEVEAVTGRHVSLDIASVCFSAFSIVSLLGFFFMEKRKAKSSK
ncbi:high-affinity nitrate transporter 3.1-like [Salvia miltiorrhiza]|uniref:high-affinity nitrate transporter 3.1-like n=1 Tax=Salvia miltiorrhiza TaxID=226208 RepID=UPI0025AC013D|nr:high-affinity nitrate transporter 3.1-like [Salvia miltiorrhiza]